jgi:hypothetical protein
MDDQQAEHFLTELLSNHRPEEEYNVRHPDDYVMEMPQSGERFRGRENMRAFQKPTPPSSLQVCQVLVKEGLWVVEGVIDYGNGRVLDFLVISELRNGKCGEADGTLRSRLKRRSGGRSGLRGWNPTKAPQA